MASRRISRRRFLGASAGLAAAACTGDDPEPIGTTTDPAGESTNSTGTTPTTSSTTTSTIAPITLADAPDWNGSDPFSLGVASGDPDEQSVVVWTRLAPDPLTGGGMPGSDQAVALDIAADEGFSDLWSSTTVNTSPDQAHTVHHLVDGLDADIWFFYRFRIGSHVSPIGRARTTPRPGDATELRFGFSSCQNWESGAYAAHRHLADEDLDLMIWLGDYIYEYGPGNQGVVSSAGLREHNSPEITDLPAYRNRYALYRSDPHLQANHAARPWVITWDDHEIDNDHAGLVSEDGQDREAFLARRRAAHQAWWEHMPVRLDPPSGDVFEIHRSIDWGDLAAIHMLDGRQFRDDQPTDGEVVPLPGVGDLVRRLGDTARNPDQRMLGEEQQRWLIDSVQDRSSIWTVLGNQVFMHGLDAVPGDQPATNTDTWDGYHANRAEILEQLGGAGADNLVVLTGDFHSSSTADLRIDPFDRTGPVVGAEFMAPAISSRFPAQLVDLAPLVLGFNPQIRHFDPANGYMTCTVTPDRWTTRLHTLADVTRDDSAIVLTATADVVAGSPGIASVTTS